MTNVDYDNVNSVIADLETRTDGKTISEIAEMIGTEFDYTSKWHIADRLQCANNLIDIATAIAIRRQMHLKPNLTDGVIYYYNDKIIYA